MFVVVQNSRYSQGKESWEIIEEIVDAPYKSFVRKKLDIKEALMLCMRSKWKRANVIIYKRDKLFTQIENIGAFVRLSWNEPFNHLSDEENGALQNIMTKNYEICGLLRGNIYICGKYYYIASNRGAIKFTRAGRPADITPQDILDLSRICYHRLFNLTQVGLMAEGKLPLTILPH